MAESPESVEKAIKRKMRWYQFSLRSLLIFVTLFAFGCSWFAVKLNEAQMQKDAVAALGKGGDSVYYDYQFDKSGRVIQKAMVPQPSWLIRLFGEDLFAKVVQAIVHDASSFEKLKSFPHLENLVIIQCHLTNDRAQCLTALPNLKRLSIGNTQLNEEDVKNIEGMTALHRLDFVNCVVTKAELSNVRKALPRCNVENVIFDTHPGETFKNY